MKKILSFALVAMTCAVLLTACNKNNFKKTENGLLYRFVTTVADGEQPQMGDVLVGELILRLEKDTLFTNRPNFKVNDLRYIPFSEGDTVIMKSIVKQVSGVDVPLFEAKMPFWSLLKGMDRQQIVNLVAEREDTDRYPGLMVGSVDNANNNAGNWE